MCGAVLDTQIYRNRLASQAKGIEMPKFLSEESKAAWVEKVRRSKAAKKQRENIALQQDEDDENLPVVTEAFSETALPVVDHPRRPTSVASLEQIGEEMRRDVAVLERAVEILSR
mgnify:FL=1